MEFLGLEHPTMQYHYLFIFKSEKTQIWRHSTNERHYKKAGAHDQKVGRKTKSATAAPKFCHKF